MLAKQSVIIGIDPGLHGAFACFDPTSGEVVHAAIIPITTVQRNRKTKTILALPELVALTKGLRTSFPDSFAYLELVGANPMAGRKQGTTSMFNFGFGAGALETAIIAAGFPYKKVIPAQWKGALGCPKDKDLSLEHASKLIPNSGEFWTPKRGVITKESCKGVAEAAMIAFFGARRLEAELAGS